MSNCSIISNNCIGIFIYQKFKVKYKSPLINIPIHTDRFIKLIENLDYYLNQDLIELKNPDVEDYKKIGGVKIDFPCGLLGDIPIYFVHETTFKEAKLKFKRRLSRLKKNKIKIIIMTESCTMEDVQAFEKLPYKKTFITYQNVRKKNFIVIKENQNKSLMNNKWMNFRLLKFLIH